MPPSFAIVYVAPFGLAHKTTVWARTLPLAEGLVARGHTATILVPPWDSPEDAGKSRVHNGVHIEQMTLQGGPASVVRRMVRRIGELAPQIVHIVKPRAHAGLVQWWLWQTRRKRRPAILLDVDDWEQAWAQINQYPWPVARFLAWQEEWGIRHADGITAASQWLMERTAAAAPSIPRLYLPNGVTPPTPQADTATAEASPTKTMPSGPPQILFFTRFVEVTPDWLRRCWVALRRAVPQAELLIAGRPLAPGLESGFRNALAGLPGVHWLGFVPPERLPGLYARCACAIFPAMPIPLHQAKCSVRLATTLLHGVPVVASAVGEQAAYGAAGAAQLVAAEATPEQFAGAVAELVATPAARAGLAERARTQLLERYRWERLVIELEGFYAATVAAARLR
ncbi:MAG TPA: glycosyltransferase family 4 protein [Caldilineaceae bacterium]|nr:glycosyltransferase family 4 protein [Caldilineaceae bacterium]